jgi:hypothetical protein
MPAHLVPASSNGRICGCLASFAQDAEHSLAALYYCVREIYDERAAHSAAEEWLQVFEERLEGSSDLPELTRITAAAIALFVSTIAKPSASFTLDSVQCEASSSRFMLNRQCAHRVERRAPSGLFEC